MSTTKQLNQSLSALEFLIGKWMTKGKVFATSSTPQIKIEGIDSYEWELSGQFILHRADVVMGDEKTEVIELIGEAKDRRHIYLLRSFDNQGNFASMEGKLNNQEILEINGDKMRARLNYGKHKMTAHWEQSEDGKSWLPWMELEFTREKSQV